MMNEAEIIQEDKAKAMCESCVHRKYCQAAGMKDHWCGNYKRE